MRIQFAPWDALSQYNVLIAHLSDEEYAQFKNSLRRGSETLRGRREWEAEQMALYTQAMARSPHGGE